MKKTLKQHRKIRKKTDKLKKIENFERRRTDSKKRERLRRKQKKFTKIKNFVDS